MELGFRAMSEVGLRVVGMEFKLRMRLEWSRYAE
jgi:hypothetical protein